jgi:hypothetical protein
MGTKNIRLVSKEKDGIEREKALKSALSEIEQNLFHNSAQSR